jgi:1,4-alpha-glucan branching enzyme
MNDTLAYTSTWFDDRNYVHDKLTYSLTYASEEHLVLPLSHDEVVHGKRSLLCRQPGDEWQQMAGLRVLSLWLMTHPGAKLTLMGNEIGQLIEWRYYEGIEYDEAQKMGSHATFQLFESMLNKFYLAQPALWELAHEREGFEWIEPNNAHQSVISFCRHGKDPADDLIVIINFRPVAYEQYRIGVPRAGYWREVLNTDDKLYGGSGVTNDFARFATDRKDFHKHTTSIKFRLPPLAGIVFRYDGDQKAALGTTHWIEDSAQQYLEMR